MDIIHGETMALNIFGKSKPDNYIELELEKEDGSKTAKNISVEVEKIQDYADSDRIQKKVRDGSILLVKIRDLKQKDMNELKRAIARIKKTCMAINGDIAGIGEDWMIVTPAIAKVYRESE